MAATPPATAAAEPEPPPKTFIAPSPGEVITSLLTNNTYTMGPQIGEGSFGVVFQCVDGWNNQLAVKVLKPIKTFEEVQAAAEGEMQRLVLVVLPALMAGSLLLGLQGAALAAGNCTPHARDPNLVSGTVFGHGEVTCTTSGATFTYRLAVQVKSTSGGTWSTLDSISGSGTGQDTILGNNTQTACSPRVVYRDRLEINGGAQVDIQPKTGTRLC